MRFFLITSSILSFLLSFSTVTGRTSCRPESCGPESLRVRFPFRVDPIQPLRCGCPGFDLSCIKTKNSSTELILNLPYGNFTVNAVDYKNQQLLIDDPLGCLPKRILQTGMIDFSYSPFTPVYGDTFVFFNCSYVLNSSSAVPCLSGDTNTILVLSQDDPNRGLLGPNCTMIREISVPSSWGKAGLDSSMGFALVLSWAKPNCTECEARGGTCGYTNRESSGVGCSDRETGLSRGTKYGLILGIGVPGALCIIALAFSIARKAAASQHNSHHGGHTNTTTTTELSASATAPQPLATISGLDEPSIQQKYPKTMLGESGRLPNPNESTCSICLSDYKPKQIIRTITECNHYFHADCIDKWLKTKGNCPLCRGSPETKTPYHSSSETASPSYLSVTVTSLSRALFP